MPLQFQIETMPGDNVATYRIERRLSCVLVFGQVPLNDCVVLAKLCPEGAHLDLALAKRLHATLVMGMPEDLAILAKRVVAGPVPEKIAAKLSPQAIQWLATGARGISSETIFTLITGVSCIKEEDMDIPYDAYDFVRCRLLLEACPEIQARFAEVMVKQPKWKPIVENWDLLCKTLDEEKPQWRDGTTRVAPHKTYRLLKELIGM